MSQVNRARESKGRFGKDRVQATPKLFSYKSFTTSLLTTVLLESLEKKYCLASVHFPFNKLSKYLRNIKRETSTVKMRLLQDYLVL